nr:hypothetical protein [Streptomyces sudanensis]
MRPWRSRAQHPSGSRSAKSAAAAAACDPVGRRTSSRPRTRGTSGAVTGRPASAASSSRRASRRPLEAMWERSRRVARGGRLPGHISSRVPQRRSPLTGTAASVSWYGRATAERG